MFLLSELKKHYNMLYCPEFIQKKFVNMDRSGKEIITYKRNFTLNEYLNLTNHYEWYFSYILQFVKKFNLQYSKLITLCETLKSLVGKKKLLSDNEKNIIFNMLNINTFIYPNFKFYINKCLKKYTKNYYRLTYWLWFNNIKFSASFIEKLTRLVMNIYNKKVEFNVVSLKQMHFNSDIFTQAVSLKLRNRDNKLYRVLKGSLRKLKLENVSKLRKQIKENNKEYIVNKIRNNKISSMFRYNIKDPLSNLLLEYFPWKDNLKRNKSKLSEKTESISLYNYVLSNLKHRKMSGVRVEAKGRLTRRFTASRSVFKLKWKGGLKNLDSSFRGLSAIMLRGHVKSNTEYSLLNSKNRNGAFGVKGWVGNK